MRWVLLVMVGACGQGGSTPDGGQPDATAPDAGGGNVVTLATQQAGPVAIAIDAQNVYWVNYVTSGSVMKVPLNGGTAVGLATADLPIALALDDTYVYFAAQGNVTTGGSIQRVPIAGGNAVTIASGVAMTPNGVQVDANNVYWTNQQTDQGVFVLPKTTTGATTAPTLASSVGVPSGAMAQDTTAIYWAAGGTVFGANKSKTDAGATNLASDNVGVRTLVVVGTALYMADDVSVGATDTSGAIIVNLVNSLNGCRGLTADTTNAYYGAQGKTLHIGVVPVTGNSNDKVFAVSPTTPIALASDADYVYWVGGTGSNGGVFKAHK
jgi:hypothetical protein